ncbi:MAG: hypothetical protein ABEH35_07255 [Haloarculaceae archaeon]
MRNITSRLAVFAVVLTVALSMMAAPAVAAPGDKVTVTDPDRMDDRAKKGVMPGDNVQMDVPGQGNEHFPDSFFDEVPGQGNEHFPDSLFDEVPGQGNEHFPDSLFDGGDQDGSDPVITK